MLYKLLVCLLSFTIVTGANDVKIKEFDALKSPNVYIWGSRFVFQDVLISVLKDDHCTYVIFKLSLAFQKKIIMAALNKLSLDIPMIINILISDLNSSLTLFWDGDPKGLDEILTKRIERILKPKFNWIQEVKVFDVQVQPSSFSKDTMEDSGNLILNQKEKDPLDSSKNRL